MADYIKKEALKYDTYAETAKNLQGIGRAINLGMQYSFISDDKIDGVTIDYYKASDEELELIKNISDGLREAAISVLGEKIYINQKNIDSLERKSNLEERLKYAISLYKKSELEIIKESNGADKRKYIIKETGISEYEYNELFNNDGNCVNPEINLYRLLAMQKKNGAKLSTSHPTDLKEKFVKDKLNLKKLFSTYMYKSEKEEIEQEGISFDTQIKRLTAKASYISGGKINSKGTFETFGSIRANNKKDFSTEYSKYAMSYVLFNIIESKSKVASTLIENDTIIERLKEISSHLTKDKREELLQNIVLIEKERELENEKTNEFSDDNEDIKDKSNTYNVNIESLIYELILNKDKDQKLSPLNFKAKKDYSSKEYQNITNRLYLDMTKGIKTSISNEDDESKKEEMIKEYNMQKEYFSLIDPTALEMMVIISNAINKENKIEYQIEDEIGNEYKKEILNNQDLDELLNSADENDEIKIDDWAFDEENDGEEEIES